MKSGLLYFDNSPKPVTAKIQAAAARYKEKYGIRPNTCFINPADVPASPASLLTSAVNGIVIASKPTILRNHIWLGVATPQPPPPSPQSL